ncbi:DUF503 domain-containing protein [Alkaliphilus peptidifermentans]|uniref:YlxP-like protein n=1 Tax=Alkaliphilus peptidifermentans DSM 18978 TaxID=1120976 RepID=A0A1G5K2Z7_9FIRM|nr:DUF503 domain-containing protein [Alkaliphilus peptidifermentans]SCY94834.1 hypothetical protein SAMN03080606_03206 [Alkaliphilus peptidifermentans DSM 18978]
MLVGVCNLRLMLFEVNSLKEKRHIIKSVIERVKTRFNVSIAEVGEMDKWQVAEIGFSCVSNSRKHADEVINSVVKFIERDGRFDITNCDVEIL